MRSYKIIMKHKETFLTTKAHELAKRLKIHYTPKHGSQFNIAEIQISVLSRWCSCHRIAEIELINQKLSACNPEYVGGNYE